MTRPLSVAIVARAVMPLHGVGGLERSVHDLVRHLALRGVEVTMIVPPAGHVQRATTADPFASQHVRIRHVRYLSFPFANRRGTTVLDRSTSYLLYGWRAGRLARSLANEGVVDLVHGFGASVLGASDGMVAPLVMNPQGLEEFGGTGGRTGLFKHLGYAPLRAAVRRTARAADAILATDVSLESTVARHLSPRPGQMVTIPNGIDLAALDAMAGRADAAAIRARAGIGADAFVLLSVGRIEANKGFDVLAAALAAASRAGRPLAATDWRWVIVGGGPFQGTLVKRIAEHGIAERVRLVGQVPDTDLHAWYVGASLFVHPTRYEGSSLVTLEAMAHRRAVVATRAGGLPDKVHPGENGWLVLPGDALHGVPCADERGPRHPHRFRRRAGRGAVAGKARPRHARHHGAPGGSGSGDA
jgi:glycosyltransferase involved in cell wall biosynthesis